MERNHRLDRAFYQMHADALAPALLGKLLCRKTADGVIRMRITETECYMGESDTACHASKGKDLCGSEELWIEDDGCKPTYHTTPRVGIGYASKEDQARLWRFIADTECLKGD